MKEQNKPETATTPIEFLEQQSGLPHQFIKDVPVVPIHCAIDMINIIQENTFTKAQCITMLEALRQRCAEEATNSRNINSFKGDIIDQIRQNVKSIDVHQFIPPLTKQ